MATLPPAKRSPIMPEPTTAARRKAVPPLPCLMGVMHNNREHSNSRASWRE
jgi:hypothetical protein